MGSTGMQSRLSVTRLAIPERWSALRLLAFLVLILGAGVLLTGCDDIDQRAVQPGVVLSSPTPTEESSAWSDEHARGGAGVWTPGVTEVFSDRNRVYFTQGGDLWQIPHDGQPAPVIEGRDILAFSSSPDGEQVALVIQEEDRELFAIVNADGSVALELELSSMEGTPVPDINGVRSIAWSPTGFSLAVAGRDGSITVVSEDGSMQQIVSPSEGSHPGDLSWSPDGRILAYLDPALTGQTTSLYIVEVESGAQREIVSGNDGRDVAAATWLPGRAALAYVLTSPSRIDRGGDVFAVDAASGAEQLLISAGQFAPVAGAVSVAASPDGQYLSLTVFVPGEVRPEFQSLWVMDLDRRELVEIETEPEEAITDLWWTSGQSLYFRAISEMEAQVTGLYTGMEPFAVYQYDADDAVTQERYRYDP